MTNADAIAGVELSEAAVRRVAAILASEASGSAVRVGVDGGGCSGFQYAFAVEAAPGAEDLLIERDGARVVIDKVSLGLLEGARIDFVDDLKGQSFRIDNPNAASSCGCGTSFSI
ncbi:MAG: iron-sulfur cluster assembly accessory protein [Methylocystis sp.]|nr:iron-sulfur cluster assembly accessory protein [Methylocystis sp.]